MVFINRTDVSPLIPEDVSREIIQNATEQSAALQLFRRVPMSRQQQRMPVLAALPVAYFVNGDTGRKGLTKVEWRNQYLHAEEIAVIIPVPESVLDDVDYDLWAQIRPLIEEAVAKALDGAIFFGVNKPATWPASLVDGAIAAGNVKDLTTANSAPDQIVRDANDVFGLIEDDGYDVSGVVAPRRFRKRLRSSRTSDGQPISDVNLNEIGGIGITYAMSDLFPRRNPTVSPGIEFVAGDWSKGIVGVRQDMTWKLLDQAPLYDESDNLVLNLAQQDAVAMRVVARFAFAVANPINREQPNEANRYPFGVLREAA